MKKTIYNNFKMLMRVWKHQKIIFLIAALFCICDIISPFQDTYLPKLIIDQLTYGSESRKLVYLVVIFLLVSIYKVILYAVYKNYFVPIAKAHVSKALNVEFMEKTKELDLKCFENEEFYNQYTRALSEIDHRAFGVFESVVALIRYMLYIGVLFGIIFVLDPILLVIAVGCAIISVFANKKILELNYKFNMDLTSAQRGCDYTRRVLYVPEYAIETRFFPITDLLIGKYKNYASQKIIILKKWEKKITLSTIIPELITTIVLHGVVVAYLIWKIASGHLTPGDFLALLLATAQFSNQLAGLGTQLNSFYANSLYIDNVNKILDYKSEIEGRTLSKYKNICFETIDFENVSFRYDDTTRKVLDGINLSIKRGEKIAIVGLNGSGKSTLIKLLLNLYNPTNGCIKLNKQDIKGYTTRDYRNLFGVVFQDYHCLAFSVGENISFKELSKNEAQEERMNIERALDKMRMLDKVNNLKYGIDTPITKELSEDGTMFSGGEIQSIMLSRLFMKPYDILILDEPTSSLDLYAEYQLYNELFLKKDTNQTLIIISHKLMTTKNADVIYYMENGKIAESGNHKELMQLGGKYAQLYGIQENYYKSEEASEEFKGRVLNGEGV